MKETQQQHYTFDKFGQHISLWNIIPAGKGNSLLLLRKIMEGIQSGSLGRNPSILIAGEGVRTLAIALANTLCSSDIREIEARYLITTRSQIDYFSDSLPDTIHIISNPGILGLSEGALWHFLRNREYKFSSLDGKNFECIHAYGTIVITAKELKAVSPPIISSVDYRVIVEPYTQQQLELIVHQRLKFCGIDYGNDEVLKSIVEQGFGQLRNIIDFLKICILTVQAEHQEKLTMKIVDQASRLVV